MNKTEAENGDRGLRRDLEREIEVLRAENEDLSGQLDTALRQASHYRTEVEVREETIIWIHSSKVFRIAQAVCRGLDFILRPFRRVPAILEAPPPVGTVVANPDPELPEARKVDILCLPIIDWEFRFQRPQQLMQQFAEAGHRIFYVRTCFHGSGPVTCSEIGPNLYQLSLPGPESLNLYRDKMSARVVDHCTEAIAAFRNQEGIHDAITVVNLPFWSQLAQALRDRWGWAIAYDCMDEHAGFATNSSDMVDTEETLLRTSDLVITTARLLTEKAQPLNSNVLRLPNAGEHEFFQRAVRLGGPSSDRPVIGYYGAISTWFDVDLIAEAAAARPDWCFRLIGRTDGANTAILRRQANIELVGEVPYPDLPDHLREFDVACIPFLDNELTRATNPVKFFEYASAGKPIVAVDLPELEPFRDYYYSASTATEFIAAVEQALSEDSEVRIEARGRFGASHTWKQRYETLDQRLAQLYGKVAVIVVSYQNIDYMRQCVDSLFQKTIYPRFEVIVVDNASEPEVTEYLQAAAEAEPRLRLILNEDNLGFAKANNQGIEAAVDADYIVLLNNDTIVPPGWLLGLTRYLRNPQIGMVGPVTSFAGNEAKIAKDYDDPSGIDAFAAGYRRKHDGLHFDIRVLAMFCVAMRKAVVDEIGLLDERYGRGMFEDDDYAIRLREAGYRTVCAEDVFVHHWGEGSFGKLERPEYQAIFKVNRKKFEDKWQREWIPHVYRHWPQDEPPSDILKPFATNQWMWSCNVCGEAQVTEYSLKASPTCTKCGSTMATRAILHAISRHFFKTNLPLPEFPDTDPLRGAVDGAWPERELVSAGIEIQKLNGDAGTEDLDFVVTTNSDLSEAERGRLASSIKPSGVAILAETETGRAVQRDLHSGWSAMGLIPAEVSANCYEFGIIQNGTVRLVQDSRSSA